MIAHWSSFIAPKMYKCWSDLPMWWDLQSAHHMQLLDPYAYRQWVSLLLVWLTIRIINIGGWSTQHVTNHLEGKTCCIDFTRASCEMVFSFMRWNLESPSLPLHFQVFYSCQSTTLPNVILFFSRGCTIFYACWSSAFNP